MSYNPDKYHRQSIRLRSYDYSQPGAYFVTICSLERECIFGEIADGQIGLNALGEIVEVCWHNLPHHYSQLGLDAFVVMPNHIHGIILLGDARTCGAEADDGHDVGARHASPLRSGTASGSLGAVIGSFKSAAAKQINQMRGTPSALVWLRNYYEHVIRDAHELDVVRRYVKNNPAQWALDEENPDVSAERKQI